MITSAKPLNSYKGTKGIPGGTKGTLSISEDELDNIMASLHEEVEPSRQEGEFTTSEYAKKNSINMGKAHKELTHLHEKGRVAKRKGNKDCFWKPVK